MKKCSNCSIEMADGYKAKLDNSPLANFVICGKGKSAKVDVYVCPNCGKVEFYIRNSIGANKKEG